MHIHGSQPINQAMSVPTQATQQAMAAKRADAEVRRKLSGITANDDEEYSLRVEARGEADPDRRQNPQPDEESFRSIFVSVSA
jgi:hypothetical protein